MLKSKQQKMCQMGRIILVCAIPLGLTSQDYGLQKLIFPHIKANELHRIQMGLTKQYHDDEYTKFGQVMRESGDWNTAEQLDI